MLPEAEGADRRAPARARARRRHGRRRRQRRAGARRGRRRHRHGHRHRRRDARAPASRWSRATSRHRPRARAEPRRRCATSGRISFFAFVYNALGVPVAAGILYPVFGLLLSRCIAAAAMSLELGLGHRQRAAAAIDPALRLRPIPRSGARGPSGRPGGAPLLPKRPSPWRAASRGTRSIGAARPG